jgi:hypothetical protein
MEVLHGGAQSWAAPAMAEPLPACGAPACRRRPWQRPLWPQPTPWPSPVAPLAAAHAVAEPRGAPVSRPRLPWPPPAAPPWPQPTRWRRPSLLLTATPWPPPAAPLAAAHGSATSGAPLWPQPRAMVAALWPEPRAMAAPAISPLQFVPSCRRRHGSATSLPRLPQQLRAIAATANAPPPWSPIFSPTRWARRDRTWRSSGDGREMGSAARHSGKAGSAALVSIAER